MLKIFGAAVAAIAMATAANAVVNVTSINGPDAGVPSNMTLIYDFDTITPVAGVDITGDYGIVTGSSNGIYAAPLGTPTGEFYLTVPVAQTPGNATIRLGGSYGTVSFYWGSIDTYNGVEFFDADGASLGLVTDAMIPEAPANGAQGDALNNRRVFFSFGGERAASFTMTSDGYAFEIDTIAGNVPEPTTWAMLIAGMGLVGASMRRRRTLTSVAA